MLCNCKRQLCRIRAMLILATLVAPAIGCDSKPPSPIEGKWQIVFFAQQYSNLQPSDTGASITIDRDMVLTINDDLVTISFGKESFTWSIDRIDIGVGKIGELDLSGKTAKQSQKGIFRLEKGVLDIRLPYKNGDRPTNFDIKANESGILISATLIK